MTERQIKNFWNKVKKSNRCWEWTGSRFPSGYGHLARTYPSGYAHRTSWILHFGKIRKGMCVLHKCDNPPCVNPDHLKIGTIQDNVRDRDIKGRYVSGMAKLNREQVKELRDKRLEGATLRQLSDEFSLTMSVISRICRKISYK